MKAIDKITQVLSDYFSEHLSSVKVKCSMDFYFCQEDNELGWTFLVTEHQDRNFDIFFEQMLGCKHFNNFIYSIFHEYGHKVTLSNFSDTEMTVYRSKVTEIESNMDLDERDFTYFNLEVERAASEWAVMYINTHYDEVYDWFENVFTPAMTELLEDKDFVSMVHFLQDEECF